MIIFAFIYGLSMDYEVFILARMREEYERTGSTNEAVVRGIASTGRLVTSAALIVFLAFASMATDDDLDVKVLATGLAAGVLLDALVVRSLLVPALVTAVGEVSGWPGRRLRESAAPEPSADAPLEQRDAGEARDRPVVAGEHPVDAATRIERLAAMSVDGDEERPPRGDREEPA
jgi:RND superfamily putative drug exporter